MKISRTQSPFSGSLEPLDANEAEGAPGAAQKDRFANSLRQLEEGLASGEGKSGAGVNTSFEALRNSLAQIALRADLSTPATAFTAVRESAQCLIRSRLTPRFQRSDSGKRLIQELSDFVTETEPLNSRVLAILKRLKAV